MSTKPRPLVLDENALSVFTDGSSYSHPRRGGVGIRFVWTGEDGHPRTPDEAPPGFEEGTNQEMELMAPTLALRMLTDRRAFIDVAAFSKVCIYSDSQYLVDNWNRARFQWPGDHWHSRDGRPIDNAALWKSLIRESTRVSIPVAPPHWHKAHKSWTDDHAKAADRLAKQSANGPLLPPLSIRKVRRKRPNATFKLGSIRPECQRVVVYVVSERRLPEQRTNRYGVQMLSEDSPYFNALDYFYSDEILRCAHAYDVQLNDDSMNPRIVECYGEVTIHDEVEPTDAPD